LSLIAFLRHAAAANALLPQANRFVPDRDVPYYAPGAKPDKAGALVRLSQ
jgi:hypothetical protein